MPPSRASKTNILRRFGRNRKGAAAVEFALVAPIFFAVLFAIIELALVFFASQILETVTQDSARLVMTGQDDAIYALERKRDMSGEVAVLEIDEPVRVKFFEVEIREVFLEIFDKEDLPVTGIEFLSPTNKSGSKGRELYVQKQEELAEEGVHLVEVDLLRGGRHVLAVPEAVVAELKPWDYLVNLARRQSDTFEFYPVQLRQRLPRIRVPLKVGDDDAVLDLQEVANRAYDNGPYPERLAYDSDPVPPLNDEDAQWADEILRSKGLRQ
jgi:Flp pilus assembly pilin Flp